MANLVVIITAAAFVIASPALALMALAPPRAGEIALIVAPPWGPGAAEIAIRTGLREISPERAPLGVLVVLETPTDVDLLRGLGAWLVVDGRKVLQLCAN